MPEPRSVRVAVYGGGELGTAAAHRLRRAGFPVFVVEVAQPTTVCRAIAAAFAVYEGAVTVDGLRFERVAGALFAEDVMARADVPVLVEPTANMLERLRPAAFIDAAWPRLHSLPFVVPKGAIAAAVGSGREAGVQVGAVVDTGAELGRVLLSGSAAPSASASVFLPVRALAAAVSGIFVAHTEIGQAVSAGEELGVLDGDSVVSPVDGHVRGLLADGVEAVAGQAIAELDLSGESGNCFTISAWARAVAGGALEAVAGLAL